MATNPHPALPQREREKTMKLIAELANSEHEISLDLDEPVVIATVDGRNHELEVRELGNGDYLLIEGSRVFRCRVSGVSDTHNAFGVALRGRNYDVSVIDPKRLRSGHTSGAHHHGSAQIVSPMPGKVVRVLVAVGDSVEAGQGVIVVEAMKMQNELKSPKTGVVASINADAGATVNAGDVLVVIE